MAKRSVTPPKGAVQITPVTVLWDGILMLPVSGIVDSKRAQEIMEAMLNKIVDTQSKVIILDVLGVPTVDSAVANHIIKMTKATKLLGCKCIITGISAEVSQTLVHLGIDLGDVVTRSTLAMGVEVAFDITGLEVNTVKAG